MNKVIGRHKGFTIAEVLMASLVLSVVLMLVTISCLNVLQATEIDLLRQEVLSYNITTVETIKSRCANGESLYSIIGDYEGRQYGIDGTLLYCDINIEVHRIGENTSGIDDGFIYDSLTSDTNTIFKVKQDSVSYLYRVEVITTARGRKFEDCNIVYYICNKNDKAGV